MKFSLQRLGELIKNLSWKERNFEKIGSKQTHENPTENRKPLDYWTFSHTKVSSSYHLCVKCFSHLSFDSEMYIKSAAVADFVYTSESNERCEKHSTQRW